MSAAREPRPTTGKKKPPLSPLDVAMRLALLTADSIMDASIIMLGADEAVRPDMAFGWWRKGTSFGKTNDNNDVRVKHTALIPKTEDSRAARGCSTPA